TPARPKLLGTTGRFASQCSAARDDECAVGDAGDRLVRARTVHPGRGGTLSAAGGCPTILPAAPTIAAGRDTARCLRDTGFIMADRKGKTGVTDDGVSL